MCKRLGPVPVRLSKYSLLLLLFAQLCLRRQENIMQKWENEWGRERDGGGRTMLYYTRTQPRIMLWVHVILRDRKRESCSLYSKSKYYSLSWKTSWGTNFKHLQCRTIFMHFPVATWLTWTLWAMTLRSPDPLSTKWSTIWNRKDTAELYKKKKKKIVHNMQRNINEKQTKTKPTPPFFPL